MSCSIDPSGQRHGKSHFEVVKDTRVYASPAVQLNNNEFLLTGFNYQKDFELNEAKRFHYKILNLQTYHTREFLQDKMEKRPSHAVKLNNGNVLLFGANSVLLYNPSTMKLKSLPSPFPRQEQYKFELHNVTYIADDKILVIFKKLNYDRYHAFYTPSGNIKLPEPGSEHREYLAFLYKYKENFSKPINIFEQSDTKNCLSIIPTDDNKFLLYYLSESPTIPNKDTFVFDLLDQNLSNLGKQEIQIPLHEYDTCPLTVLLKDNSLLLVGSYEGKAYLYNYKDNRLEKISDTYYKQLQTATRLGNEKVLLAGGVIKSTNLLSSCRSYYVGAEIYDPNSKKFTKTSNLNIPNQGFNASPLSNNRVLLFGGSDEADCDSGRPLSSEAVSSEIFIYDRTN